MSRVALAFALLFGVAATPSASFAATDAWITAKTKMALMTADGVSAQDVNVDTVDGRVTLHGKVSSDAEKNRATEVARKIDGTREVRNLLQVVPPSAEKAVATSDDQIQKDVTAALKGDPQLEDSDVTVQSVNKGVVLLAGSAKTFSAHLSAVETASHVAGVRRVASEVKSPDTLSDAEVRRGTVADAMTESSRATSRVMDDMRITSATKVRLLADSETPALDINVDTHDGVVTLFGTVSTEAQKQAAEANARKVSGVKSVKNDLQVVASSRQEAVSAKDDDLEKAIESALDKRDSLSDADIDVEVKNGVVRLTGSVPSEADRITAAVVARSTPGVRSVLAEDLRIKQG
jgi:hyperosmotically inducible protein